MRKSKILLAAIGAVFFAQMAQATVIEFTGDVTFGNQTVANAFGTNAAATLKETIYITLTYDETITGLTKDAYGYIRSPAQSIAYVVGNKSWSVSTSDSASITFNDKYDEPSAYQDSMSFGGNKFHQFAYGVTTGVAHAYGLSLTAHGPDADVIGSLDLQPLIDSFSTETFGGTWYFVKKKNGQSAGQAYVRNVTMVQEPDPVPEPMAAGFLGFFGVILMAIGLLRKGRRLA